MIQIELVCFNFLNVLLVSCSLRGVVCTHRLSSTRFLCVCRLGCWGCHLFFGVGRGVSMAMLTTPRPYLITRIYTYLLSASSDHSLPCSTPHLFYLTFSSPRCTSSQFSTNIRWSYQRLRTDLAKAAYTAALHQPPSQSLRPHSAPSRDLLPRIPCPPPRHLVHLA